MESPIYEQVLRAVHEVNRGLQRGEPVRVLGGDSKIDWGRIVRAEDLVSLVNRRGNIRNIIAEQILEPRLKGAGDFWRRSLRKEMVGVDFRGSSPRSTGPIAPGQYGRWWARELL